MITLKFTESSHYLVPSNRKWLQEAQKRLNTPLALDEIDSLYSGKELVFFTVPENASVIINNLSDK